MADRTRDTRLADQLVSSETSTTYPLPEVAQSLHRQADRLEQTARRLRFEAQVLEAFVQREEIPAQEASDG